MGLRFVPMLLMLASVASAQEMTQPSDTELRSAYCITVLQWQVNNTSQFIAASESSTPPQDVAAQRSALEKLGSALDRLRSYLVPRIGHRDPAGLRLAYKRGQDDIQQLDKSAQCELECKAKSKDSAACAESCTDKALVARMRACSEPSWLPF
jgi:hypothetical protein